MLRGPSPHPVSRICRRWSRRWAGWLALVCAGACLVGADAQEPDFHQRAWTTDDGLPHNSVGNVVQDHEGYLWLATVGGLARFDGREFRAMRPPAELRSLGFNIRGLAEEFPGTLVVLGTGRNLLRLTGTTWSLHPINSALAETIGTAMDVVVDARGSVWLATTEGRAVRWSPNGQTTIFGPDEGLVARSRPISLATSRNGDTWIGAGSLFRVAPGGEPVRVLPSIRDPRALATGDDDRLWVVTNRRLLRVERDRIVGEHELPADHQLGAVRHLFEDRSGAVWIATTRRGLLRFDAGNVSCVANAPTSFVAEDREGNIWAAFDGRGIGRLRAKSYRLLNRSTGLPEEGASAVAEDSRGRVWLALRSSGLVSIEGDTPPQPSGLEGQRAFANVVVADGENRIWFGGGRNGLSRWEPESGREPVHLPEPSSDLHLLFRARNGDIWYAANAGRLGLFRGDDVRVFGAAEGYAAQDIRAIAQDRHGDLWLGGRAGELLRWDGTRFTVFNANHGLPREPIHAIGVDSKGAVWIGTASGLVLKDADQFRVLTEEHGLADDIIQQILDDGRGHLWFAARRGLFYANRDQLVAVARGSAGRVDSHRLGPGEGLVGLSPTANYQPGACKTADGKLWFATSQGVVAVDPARVPNDLPPPPVLVDDVRIDGRVRPTRGPLRVRSGRHRFEFKVAALNYAAPESVVVRHQLEGVDAGWIDTGSDRIVSYTNLAPGDYRLRVIARNGVGRWNHEGATLALTIVPAWWETTAVRVGAIVLLTAFTAWIARRIAQRRLRDRLRRLEQEHALEKERQRIARDLHDDLGASLTELGLMADRLSLRNAQEIAPQLTQVAWHTRRLATELSGIVWAMSPRNASLDRLAEFIRQYAQRLFRGLTIACHVKSGERLPPLPLAPDLQHQIIAIAREALNNVLKHSRATEVEIGLHYADGHFAIVIVDNGCGFSTDAASVAEGNGLRNMHARSTDIGAILSIDSTAGRGTQVKLSVPLHVSV